MSDVIVWSHEAEHGYELLAGVKPLAQQLGGKVIALALGDLAATAQEYAARGADLVLTNSDGALKGLNVEPYADALHQIIQQRKPSLVLVGSGIRAKDVAARVATRLEVGLGSEQSHLRLEGGKLVGERPFFSGNSMLAERLVKEPMMSCVPARAYEAAPKGGPAGRVEPVALTFKPAKANVVKSEKKTGHGVNLEDAPVIVSVGRGVKKKEDLAIAEDLAKAIGAAIGCTRPIAADLKWLGDENWIGLSGHEVKPKAYIGLGVSGQIQHVAGMRGSKLIIAINKDEEAPLVKMADYSIVDDLYKVTPALAREVRKLKGA